MRRARRRRRGDEFVGRRSSTARRRSGTLARVTYEADGGVLADARGERRSTPRIAADERIVEIGVSRAARRRGAGRHASHRGRWARTLEPAAGRQDIASSALGSDGEPTADRARRRSCGSWRSPSSSAPAGRSPDRRATARARGCAPQRRSTRAQRPPRVEPDASLARDRGLNALGPPVKGDPRGDEDRRSGESAWPAGAPVLPDRAPSGRQVCLLAGRWTGVRQTCARGRTMPLRRLDG